MIADFPTECHHTSAQKFPYEHEHIDSHTFAWVIGNALPSWLTLNALLACYFGSSQLYLYPDWCFVKWQMAVEMSGKTNNEKHKQTCAARRNNPKCYGSHRQLISIKADWAIICYARTSKHLQNKIVYDVIPFWYSRLYSQHKCVACMI